MRLVTDFDGSTFDELLDGKRLRGQLKDVLQVMKDGQWRSLREIVVCIGKGSETGISARLRDLRKVKFGGCVVESRRRAGNGVWEYRVKKEAGHVAS